MLPAQACRNFVIPACLQACTADDVVLCQLAALDAVAGSTKDILGFLREAATFLAVTLPLPVLAFPLRLPALPLLPVLWFGEHHAIANVRGDAP